MDSTSMVLDLMLKALIKSLDDCSLEISETVRQNATSVICRVVPGTTPEQCEKRFDELLTEFTNEKFSKLSLPGGLPHPNRSKSDRRQQHGSALNSSASRTISFRKSEEKEKMKNTGTGAPQSSDNGQVMVIHVCDETKKLKQDFHCPRDLLVREMRYFAEYLSTETQHAEEVDISVHCDIQIFDWLLRYIKRSLREQSNHTPSLEPGNVISILISSDFLKMDSLVDECVGYCHQNMSAILATSCNMNCIEDRLVCRIADLFDHNELDAVVDKKDKFKSKLFSKKIKSLFEFDTSSASFTGNTASRLFRCLACKKVLSRSCASKVKCLNNRIFIDRHGDFGYRHDTDPSFDINDFIIELKHQKTWAEVYWHLWGTLNHLVCSRCGDTFQCCDLTTCHYHPELATSDSSGKSGELGELVHPCCGLKVIGFDPTPLNKGCRTKDHVVDLKSIIALSSMNTAESRRAGATERDKQRVYRELLAHREIVCQPHQRGAISLKPDNTDLDIYADNEIACGLRGEEQTLSNLSKHERRIALSQPRIAPSMADREAMFDDKFYAESDDDVDEDEDDEPVNVRRHKSKPTAESQAAATALNPSDFNSTKHGIWDPTRSMRYNQDAQREDEQMRIKEIVNYLVGLRADTIKQDRLKQREYAGGLFSKLDAQWRAVNVPPPTLRADKIKHICEGCTKTTKSRQNLLPMK